MTAIELNSKLADMIDVIMAQVEQFVELRDDSTDETWDKVCEAAPWADALCDIEYFLEAATRNAKL